MRADGRRLGRIIGQLDDIETLLAAYDDDGAYYNPVIQEHLVEAWDMVRRAKSSVDSAAYMINEETPRDD